jgi:hypothetical protein
VLFAGCSLGFRYGFAMVCWVSAASLPPHSLCASDILYATALHIIETLTRPKRLPRVGGASATFGLPMAYEAIRCPPRHEFSG